MQFNKPHGGRTHGIRVCKTLSEEYDVVVFNTDLFNNKYKYDYHSGYESVIDSEEKVGIKFDALPIKLRGLLTAIKTIWRVNQYDLDIIYVDGSFMLRPVIGWICSRLFDIPLIVNVTDQAGREVMTQNFLFKILNGPIRKMVLENSECLVLESELILEDLHDSGIIPREYVIAPVTGGIELERFDKRCPDVSEANCPTVFYVGRDKDLELLFDAVPKVADEVSNVEFRFAGFGSDQYPGYPPEYTTFLGVISRKEIYKEIKQSHVCVVPYTEPKTAGRPMKLSEYMAAGACVVATDRPYSTQMITDVENGIITEPTLEAFADGVISALNKDALRVELGARARADIKSYAEQKRKNLFQAIKIAQQD